MKHRHLLRSAAAGITVVLALVVVPGATAAAAAPPHVLLPPTISSTSTTFTVESPTKFTFHRQSDSIEPVSYIYQLNVGPPQQVAATNGRASVSIFPDRFTNQLTVTSVAGDGSFSDSVTDTFNAAYPPPTADQDINDDGSPDLITIGGTAGLSSGLWQATGRGNRGQVKIPALNIGVNGNGVAGDGLPADFDGGQVITGKFAGTSFEDFLVYYPGGVNPGGGVFLTGNGRGAVPSTINEFTLLAGMLTDVNGDNPIQVVNAYDGAGDHLAYPDLLGIVGSPVIGYTLDYYPSMDGRGLFASPTALALPTPTGGADWENWRLASKLLPSGVALVLWNPTTGALYLWEGVTFNVDSVALSFTSYQLATSWQASAQLSALQLTDVNADGVPDLWAVTPDGDVTAYLVSNLSLTAPARIKAAPTQHLA